MGEKKFKYFLLQDLDMFNVYTIELKDLLSSVYISGKRIWTNPLYVISMLSNFPYGSFNITKWIVKWYDELQNPLQ
jgi:hypothetical protein